MELGGLRIATIRGIPIRIHWTFLLVLPFIAFGFARAFRDAAQLAGIAPARIGGSPVLWGFGLAIALFVSVLLHELAHSLYALRKGGQVRDITLLMIGGVSQISEPPKRARDEGVMALVGPLLSIVLGALLWALQFVLPRTAFGARFGLFYLGVLNLFLGGFNLLPAFPMDGGRVLRALLTPKLGTIKATQLAASLGKAFAVLFGIWGFFTFNLLLMLIAFFIYLGAEGETRGVLVKLAVGKLKVRDLMSPAVLSVPEEASVFDTGERMLRERRLAFAVTEAGHPVGLVTLEAVHSIPPEAREEVQTKEIAIATPPLSPDDDAGKALKVMTETRAPLLAVAERGQLVGMISRNDIIRGLKLSELEESQHARPSWPMRRGNFPI